MIVFISKKFRNIFNPVVNTANIVKPVVDTANIVNPVVDTANIVNPVESANIVNPDGFCNLFFSKTTKS